MFVVKIINLTLSILFLFVCIFYYFKIRKLVNEKSKDNITAIQHLLKKLSVVIFCLAVGVLLSAVLKIVEVIIKSM